MSEGELPTLRAVRRYMRFAGWTEQAPGPAGTMWRFNGSRIGVPSEPDGDLIFGVVRRLAAAERREVAEVLTRIQYLLYDVTDLVATGEDPETHGVPLTSAARIINSARTMLRATATTAIAERAQIASNYSDRGDSVIHDSLVGHTKRNCSGRLISVV